MKARFILRRIFFAFGALLALQLLVWLASGAALAVLDSASVRGEGSRQKVFPAAFTVRTYANPGGVIVQAPGTYDLRLKYFLDRAVYETRGAEGAALFDASNGEKLSPLSEEMARRVARRDFVGESAIETIEWLSAPPAEYDGEGPVWAAAFDDDLATRLYISPFTGEVEARVNRLTRLHAALRRLHLLDVSGEGRVNNPLLRAAAGVALAMFLLGIVLAVLGALRRPSAK